MLHSLCTGCGGLVCFHGLGEEQDAGSLCRGLHRGCFHVAIEKNSWEPGAIECHLTIGLILNFLSTRNQTLLAHELLHQTPSKSESVMLQPGALGFGTTQDCPDQKWLAHDPGQPPWLHSLCWEQPQKGECQVTAPAQFHLWLHVVILCGMILRKKNQQLRVKHSMW